VIRYKRLPNNRRISWRFICFYYQGKDGKAVLKGKQRPWMITGFVVKGVHEFIFRERRLQSP
jgi:hypothetical protein